MRRRSRRRRPKPATALAVLGAAIFVACAAVPGPPAPLAVALPDLSSPVEDRFPREKAPGDRVCAVLFARINRDRASQGLPAVLWDERAAAVARATTRRQITERTNGHFLLDGLPPYARLSAGGDFGMGKENAAAFMSDAGRLHEPVEALALRAETEMLNEKPPRDSHRRTILDPSATHVGIGWAMEGGEFRLSSEFTARGYERLRVRRQARGTGIEIDGAALSGAAIRWVAVAREPVPRPISRAEANRRESYSYPAAQLMLLPERTRERAVGVRSVRTLSEGAGGAFFFSYDFDAPGVWTFTLYFQRRPGRPEPGGVVTVLVKPVR